MLRFLYSLQNLYYVRLVLRLLLKFRRTFFQILCKFIIRGNVTRAQLCFHFFVNFLGKPFSSFYVSNYICIELFHRVNRLSRSEDFSHLVCVTLQTTAVVLTVFHRMQLIFSAWNVRMHRTCDAAIRRQHHYKRLTERSIVFMELDFVP